jgi:hypothetical protein
VRPQPPLACASSLVHCVCQCTGIMSRIEPDPCFDLPQCRRLTHKAGALTQMGKEVTIVSGKVGKEVFILGHLKHLCADLNGNHFFATQEWLEGSTHVICTSGKSSKRPCPKYFGHGLLLILSPGSQTAHDRHYFLRLDRFGNVKLKTRQNMKLSSTCA